MRALSPSELPLSLRAASATLRQRLGPRSVVVLDRSTRTPRLIAKLDGYLTGRSSRRPAEVALAFVREHPQLFGLRGTAVRGLRVVRSWRRSGMTHLVFSQSVRGVRVAGNPLVANVAADGRLINIGGAPLRRLRPNALRPVVTPARAVALATSGRGVSRRAPALRLVRDGGALRLAWRVVVRKGSQASLVTVDAVTERVLRRESLTRAVTAQVYRNYPGAPVDGSPAVVDISRYVAAPGSPYLYGNYAYAFNDVNDDQTIQSSEDVPPSDGVDYAYSRIAFSGVAGAQCPSVGCSWNPNAAFSWQSNLRHHAVQAFYFVNRFHDHLAAHPIDFVRAKGNFEGDARIWINVDAGADTKGTGLPDDDHVNNAFMAVFPTSGPPPMALIELLLVRPKDDLLAALDTASDPAVVYHEVTHGMTNRLVADADGFSVLSGPQGRALDEGWADWYSLDYLNAEGYAPDTAVDGDVRMARYVGVENNVWRTQGLDCPTGSSGAGCPGAGAAGRGGYTYGDFGKVAEFPEPHADGEIWAETLWDLRAQLIGKYGLGGGMSKAELLVTRGLELTPAAPTFLDARDAILQADTVFNSGADRTTIWQVFARRGMGYLASARDAGDVRPVEDFSLPPAPGSTGALSGVVRDSTGAPLAHSRVWIGGHASGLLESLAATTDDAGRYTISSVMPATYPNVFAEAPGGYAVAAAAAVAVSAGVTTKLDFTLERNWAAAAGGATIASWTGPDYSPDCGAAQAIDGSGITAWLTTSPASAEDPGPKTVTIRLPRAIDVSSFAIDPTTDQDNCATGITSSLGSYRIETSTDGQTFVESVAGTFTQDDTFRLNTAQPAPGTAARVTHIRLTGVSTQNSAPGFRGAVWMGVAAVEVHGTPVAAAPNPGPGVGVVPVTPPPPAIGIDLTPPPVRCVVPRLVGSQLTVARRRLLANHCRLGRVKRVRSKARRGTVLAQTRRAGRKLPNGSKIGVTLSSGRR